MQWNCCLFLMQRKLCFVIPEIDSLFYHLLCIVDWLEDFPQSAFFKEFLFHFLWLLLPFLTLIINLGYSYPWLFTQNHLLCLSIHWSILCIFRMCNLLIVQSDCFSCCPHVLILLCLVDCDGATLLAIWSYMWKLYFWWWCK